MVNQWIKHLGRTRKQHPELKNDFKGLAAKAKETYKPQHGGSCEDPTNCSEGMQGGLRSRKKRAGTHVHRGGKRRVGKKSRKAGMHMRGGDDHTDPEEVPAPPGPPAPDADIEVDPQDGGESPLETGNADDAPAPAPDAAEPVNDDAPDAAPDAQEGGRRRRRRKSSSKRRSHKKSHGRKKSARKSKRKSKRRSRR